MRPPGTSATPYGTGAAVLIVGLKPSAGAAGLLPILGKTSKPSAAAAAMPRCAIDGWSSSLAGGGGAGVVGPTRSTSGKAFSPVLLLGRSRLGTGGRALAATLCTVGAVGGTIISRLPLLER